MLTANIAVNSMINGGSGKSSIWRINADGEYHEEAAACEPGQMPRSTAKM